MHAYYHHIGDYRKDTAHLSLVEHGIYRQLLDTYYLDERPLTLDHAKLMRSHSVRSADEVRAFENVLQDFFVRTEEGYVHKRCESEIAQFKAKSDSASRSAKARWAKQRSGGNANAMRTHSEGNANQQPETTDSYPSDKKKQRVPRFDARGFLLANGASEKTVDAWLEIRKGKRLKQTDVAMESTVDEARKAGMTLEAALTLCCKRGWGGFDAAWVSGRSPPPNFQDRNDKTIAGLTGWDRTTYEPDDRTIDV
jgi:uncharacterized protein YdaU (DUF1376 family)